jgi:hypothetical protein
VPSVFVQPSCVAIAYYSFFLPYKQQGELKIPLRIIFVFSTSFACTVLDTLLITVYPQIFLIIVWLSVRDLDTENQLRALRGDLYFIS